MNLTNIHKRQALQKEIVHLMSQQQSAILNGRKRYARFLENCIKDAKRELKGLK